MIFEREKKRGTKYNKIINLSENSLFAPSGSPWVCQQFANNFQWEIPIETHTCAELGKRPIYAILNFNRFWWRHSSDFYYQTLYDECEVPIPDVSLCLCLDMRLREQCYQNGGAQRHICGILCCVLRELIWGQNHIDKVVTLVKKHLKNWENTSIKAFFVCSRLNV